ncbi:MAG: DUF4397 domain-containing protein [Gammaproteobacteria bacterium]|nr:DUF4397 domain-containing protein [Gammaproteobacteria bacterium]
MKSSPKPRFLAALAATLVVAGCGGGGGEVDNDLAFRVVHVAPDAPAVNILLDGVVFRQAVPYKGGTNRVAATPREYTFAVEAITADGPLKLFPDQTVDLQAGVEYTLLALGEGSAGSAHPLQPLLIQNDFADIPADNVRLQVVHGAPDLAAVDVYLTAIPDAPAPLPPLAGATPLATVTYAAQPAARQLRPSDSYVIRVTPAGDPGTVLYTSNALAFASRLDVMMILVESDVAGESPLSVLLQTTGSGEALDRATVARARAVHLSPDSPALDLIGTAATTSFPEALFSAATNPVGVAVDAANGRALVVDNQLGAIVAVDLGTGSRTVLSDNTSAGTPFRKPVGIALDTVNNRALVTDEGLSAVLAVDLATGARTVLSDIEVPDAANVLSAPAGIAIDAANNRALVVDNRADRLIAVNLQTGSRSVLSSAGTPDTSNNFLAPVAIAIDGTRALVVDNGLDAVLAVDLATGARTILSSGTVPNTTAPLLSGPIAITVDAANGRALVLDNRLQAVVAVNLTTGARTVLSSNTVPDAANTFSGPAAVALNGPAALVLDARLGTLFGVDLATGARSLVSDGGGPTGITYLDATPYQDLIADTYAVRGEKSAAPNPLAPLFSSAGTLAPGNRYTIFVAGLLATSGLVVATDQTRPTYTEGKLRFFDAAPGSGTVDLYILEAGDTVADSDPTFVNLTTGRLIGHLGFKPGTYTVAFTTAGTKTVLASNSAVVAAAGSAQTVVLADEVRLVTGDDGKPPAIVIYDDLEP